jgi:hypothetical protein
MLSTIQLSKIPPLNQCLSTLADFKQQFPLLEKLTHNYLKNATSLENLVNEFYEKEEELEVFLNQKASQTQSLVMKELKESDLRVLKSAEKVIKIAQALNCGLIIDVYTFPLTTSATPEKSISKLILSSPENMLTVKLVYHRNPLTEKITSIGISVSDDKDRVVGNYSETSDLLITGVLVFAKLFEQIEKLKNASLLGIQNLSLINLEEEKKPGFIKSQSTEQQIKQDQLLARELQKKSQEEEINKQQQTLQDQAIAQRAQALEKIEAKNINLEIAQDAKIAVQLAKQEGTLPPAAQVAESREENISISKAYQTHGLYGSRATPLSPTLQQQIDSVSDEALARAYGEAPLSPPPSSKPF